MCGIAGIVDLEGKWSPEERTRIAAAMADSMPYRGPDDRGVWLSPDGACALAHRRLSIIDTSSGGHQPFVLGDGRHALSFNGEIYNYLELRQELEAQGHAFATRSDTEVLLHLLAGRGEGAIERLDGQFAFAHWHSAERTLLLARDPFGEKPLYWSQGPGWFAFASELHALTRVPGFDPAIDADTIAEYLALQYVDAPRSIYRHAQKLKPGHWLRLHAGGETRIGRHFAFAPRGGVRPSRPMGELAEELEAILLRLIRRRMIADVPLGAFLSGGVDSSTVVALMTKALGGTVKTFSIGFENAPDETEHLFARQVAQHLGTDHHDRVLELDVLPLMHHIGTVLDEPNGDSSCLPTFLVSKIAKEQVTVCLSGDGGDEMFGGYGRYFATLQDESRLADFDAGRQYFGSRMLIHCDEHLAELFGAVPPRTAALLASLRRRMGRDPGPLLHRMRAYDAAHYMPGAVLPKVDRMSMQHSLEVRTPFLSRELAAFAEQLAVDDCYAPGSLLGPQGKLVLKEVAQRYLPRQWLDRRKMGFGVPTKTGWGRDKMLAWLQELVLVGDSKLAQWIDAKGRAAYARRLASPGNFSFYQAWLVLVLEIWLRQHAQRRGEPATTAAPIEVRPLAEAIGTGCRQEDLLLCQHLRSQALPPIVFCADELPSWVHELPAGSLLVTPQPTETPAPMHNRVLDWNGTAPPDHALLAGLPLGPAVFTTPLREAHADVVGALSERGQTILHRIGDRWRARDTAASATVGGGTPPRLADRLFGERLPARPGAIEPAGGFAWRIALPKLARARALDRTARLVVYENDRRLPHDGSSPQAIVHFGRGRHALDGEWLWFSASDNSDPTTNGRRYLVALQSSTRGGLLHFLGRTPLAHLALDAREGLERLRQRRQPGPLPLRFRFRRPFPHDGGACWLASLRRMRVPLALLQQGWRPVVLEDGTALGPADAVHEDVRRLGLGRYSVWDDMIWFAASDNGNPNRNGRTYQLVLYPPGSTLAHDDARQGVELQPALASPAEFDRELAQLAAEPAPHVPELGTGSRIAMVIGALHPGGTERQLCNLAVELDRRGHRVSVLALSGLDGSAGHYRALLHGTGVELVAANHPAARFTLGAAARCDRRLRLLASLPAGLRDEVWRLFSHFATLQPDVAHCCLDGPNISGGIAALLAGVPLAALGIRSFNPTHYPHQLRPWFAPYYRLLATSPRVRMFANSRVCADDYRAWLGVDPGFRLVRNGLDTAALGSSSDAERQAFRAEFGIPLQAPLCAGLLRLAEEKQPLVFVRAIAAALRRVPDLHAVLAGIGPMQRDVEQLARELAIEPRLHLVGRRHDVATIHGTADVVLLTSRIEGTPNALLEAMWFRRPVVATRAGGCVEVVEDGVHGRLCDVGDADGLGAAVAGLLQDPALRARMGDAGHAAVQQRFSLPRMVDDTLAIYRGSPS
ncbi:MAG: asparagine synthase (glutamine-hydrolyzing) [Planctomycetes bacterium]|nr:asparagine synthase (glutamine-hydrolyzing) [Planctomycetota bacterium]